MRSLFDSPPVRSVGRTLLIAVVWSVVLVLVSAAMLGIVALIAGGVGLATSGSGVETMVNTARAAGWVIGSLDVVVLVWVAAYASTGWGSRRRALLGAAAGLGIAIGYVLLGSLGGPMAGLAIGWGIVVPAERPGRVAARALPALIAAVFVPGPASAGPAVIVSVAVLSAPIAALFVYLGDAIWSAVARRRIV